LLCRALSLCVAALILLCNPVAALAQQPDYLASVPYPNFIRVAIRADRPGGTPDPAGRILYVTRVDFHEYIRDALPNEWFPSWHPNSLQAGALAVKMFGWYHTLHPTTLDGFTFDVDNTTNFQMYDPGHRSVDSEAAVDAALPLAFVEPDGRIVDINYRAGYQGGPNPEYRNENMMSQWGSQYLAEVERRNVLGIMQYYYRGRVIVRVPGR